ncbi:MAG TPA: hypothetical protein VEL76_09780 [Gemmataceae bacterium]|nr:hypothetical protein [Gemmataceae bacterium]
MPAGSRARSNARCAVGEVSRSSARSGQTFAGPVALLIRSSRARRLCRRLALTSAVRPSVPVTLKPGMAGLPVSTRGS